MDFEIIGLQEGTFSKCSHLESHYYFISILGHHKQGTAVFVRQVIPVSRELLDPDGRLISVDVGLFTFITIYAPSGSRAVEERNDLFRCTISAYANHRRLFNVELLIL